MSGPPPFGFDGRHVPPDNTSQMGIQQQYTGAQPNTAVGGTSYQQLHMSGGYGGLPHPTARRQTVDSQMGIQQQYLPDMALPTSASGMLAAYGGSGAPAYGHSAQQSHFPAHPQQNQLYISQQHQQQQLLHEQEQSQRLHRQETQLLLQARARQEEMQRQQMVHQQQLAQQQMSLQMAQQQRPQQILHQPHFSVQQQQQQQLQQQEEERTIQRRKEEVRERNTKYTCNQSSL